MADIDVLYAVGLMIAFFIGFFMRYISDYLDVRLNRKPPRYEKPGGE